MALDVRPVAGKRDLDTFIKLPWRLYRNEPNWVPPLLFERRRFFDRERNPFFEHAEVEYFLAWRDGRAVGRIKTAPQLSQAGLGEHRAEPRERR